MFNHIGIKIKILATTVSIIGILLSIIGGIYIWVKFEEELFFIGLLIIFGGSLASWIGGFFAYGFGQLIENTDKIAENTEALLYLTKNTPPEENHNDTSRSDDCFMGFCPYCEKTFSVPNGTKIYRCPHCKNKVFFDEDSEST